MDKSIIIRLLLAIMFSICFFVFLHFREVRVEIPELNSIAERYIVSQTDFEFYNEEVTIILQQSASHDIGKIYQIDEDFILKANEEFSKRVINRRDWTDIVDGVTLEELYQDEDKLKNSLLSIRFTDAKTIQKMRQHSVSIRNYMIYVPLQLEVDQPLRKEIWEYLQRISFRESTLSRDAIDFIVQFFKGREWQFAYDQEGHRLIRRSVVSSVPRQYTKVSAGDRILSQGEKVEPRHLAMLLSMKKALSESRNLWDSYTILGSLFITLLFVGLLKLYLQVRFPDILFSNRKLFLLALIILITLGLSKAVEHLLLSSGNLIEIVRYPIVVPFASILVCAFMNVELSLFVSGYLILILSMALSLQSSFLAINVVASVITILTSLSLYSRKEIFMVCFKSWIACCLMLIAYHFYSNDELSYLLLSDFLSTLISLMLIAVLVIGLLSFIESVFPIMTDAVLMEYIDPNNDLLNRLAMEAPGTYQHSIVVGTLAEAAAQSIGANSLFCRVAALYHDVGKLRTPYYFTENQQKGMNMHQLLTPLESAQVIIAHVCEGVAMARKAGLPEQFIDIIKEHHGTTYAYYFYKSQLELVGGDKNKITDQDFRYVGPKPRSKESAIIMIADSLEAASRSLSEINEDTVTELITTIVRDKANDGQFDQCRLTFEELSTVQKTLVKSLVNSAHRRVKYEVLENSFSSGFSTE